MRVKKKSKILINVLTAIIFTIISVLFCGCRKTETTPNIELTGEFYDISTIYENGEISKSDLLTLLYYKNNGIPFPSEGEYPDGFVPAEKEPSILDETTETQIGLKYKLDNGYDDKYPFRVYYYGTYGDYIAVTVLVEKPIPPDVYYIDYGEWVFVVRNQDDPLRGLGYDHWIHPFNVHSLLLLYKG